MESTVNELRRVIADFMPKISAIPDAEFSGKPLPHKWSKKQVIGHLADSAQNNLRRFIVAQYDPTPNIVYEQDFWVNSNQYQEAKKEDVIMLWRLLNERICAILLSMPKENYSLQVNTGGTEQNLHTLEWLAADYVRHLKHHLNQVLPGSFDITYP